MQLRLGIIHLMFSSLGMEVEIPTGVIEGEKVESCIVNTPDGDQIEFNLDNTINVLPAEDAPSTYLRSSSLQFDTVEFIEGMLNETDINYESSVNDAGTPFIRIEDNVLGAQSIDFIFGTEHATFTHIAINEE